MGRMGRFKRYLRGKLTGIGDGLDGQGWRVREGMRTRGVSRMAPEFLA